MRGLRRLRIGLVWWSGHGIWEGTKENVDSESALAVLTPMLIIRQVPDEFVVISSCDLPAAVWQELGDVPFVATVEEQKVKKGQLEEDMHRLAGRI